MASFSEKIQGLSLPIKVASGAVLTALFIIFLVVGFLEGAVHDAFKLQLNSVLEEKAFQHRVRFSRSVEAYSHAAKLLSTQRSLIDHLHLHQQSTKEYSHVMTGEPPVWLPNFTLLRSFIAPHYAMLFDSHGHLLDLYQNWPAAPPEELQEPDKTNLMLATGQTHIIMIGAIPYLLAAEKVKDNNGLVMGHLLLSTPLDETFMIATNGPATDWNLVALIDDATGRVISSNSRAKIAEGKRVVALTDTYEFTEPKFLALGGMELAFRFASLVSKDSVNSLSETLISKERKAHYVVAAIYMGPFVIIIYWLTRRIMKLTNKVEEFSLTALGSENEINQDFSGDQIDILEKRFLQLTKDIKKRTSQLETANQELEAFAYSVSHDLRAPLRSIDGFSQALDEEYRDQLDEAGHDYLKRVRKAAQKMGTLIDEILMLSRLSRKEMKMGRVDLSRIADRVVQELRQNQPDRDVEVRIARGMVAFGDRGLLNIVVTNLLDNAWKFTSKTEKALIEFSVVRGGLSSDNVDPPSTVFCVADNGAGFDMEFVDKLFSAFQRLHRDSDFPGTGVGLATVQRIINRHQGIIWAEGEVDKGAKFFFSI